MTLDLLFALRGLLSFVAFSEAVLCVRCLLPLPTQSGDTTFIQTKVFGQADLITNDAISIISHLYATLNLLSALLVLHLAIYSHHRPLVWPAFCCVGLKASLLILHTFVYKYIPLDQQLVFPLISAAVAIVSVLLVPVATREGLPFQGDENKEILKSMTFPTKKMKKKMA